MKDKYIREKKMFVAKINSFTGFGNANAPQQNKHTDGRRLDDSQKLDILIRRINALQTDVANIQKKQTTMNDTMSTMQLDVEKMRARQQVADKTIATGVMNLLKSDAGFYQTPGQVYKAYDEMSHGVAALDKMA